MRSTVDCKFIPISIASLRSFYSESEGSLQGEEDVAALVETIDVDVVLGRRSDRWHVERDIAGPDSAWNSSGGAGATRGRVGLIVDLGAKEIALELKVSNGDGVCSESSNCKDDG